MSLICVEQMHIFFCIKHTDLFTVIWFHLTYICRVATQTHFFISCEMIINIISIVTFRNFLHAVKTMKYVKS
jgi:hypothetical protein